MGQSKFCPVFNINHQQKLIMKINGTEVQLSQNETAMVSQLYGHMHFHGVEYAQTIATMWISEAKDDDATTRRREATRALNLSA